MPIAQLNDNDEGEPLPLGKLFTVKILWVFMLLMLCSGAAEQAMSQWASFFAETELGVSKQVADVYKRQPLLLYGVFLRKKNEKNMELHA